MLSLPFFHKCLIAVSLCLGLYFRFEELDKKLIWHDEVGTRLFSAGLPIDEWQSVLYTGAVLDVAVVQAIHRRNIRGPLEVIKGLMLDDPQHPPLYYILAGIWTHAFGDSIATLRLLSALLSLLALPAMYWLGRELFGGHGTSWTAVALIAVSPFFVLYAQEGREYALYFVLILFSNASLLRAIRLSEGTRLDSRCLAAWALFAALSILALYTSLASASIMIAQAIYIMFREKFRITRISLISAGAFAIVVLLFLPWAIALLMRWEAFAISMAWSKVISIPTRSLLEINALNISRPSIDFWPDRNHGGLLTAAGIGLATLTAVSAIGFLLIRSRLKAAGLALALILVPIMMLLGPDLLWGGIRSVSARYIAPSLIGLELALAFFYASMGRKWSGSVILTLALVLRIASCFHNSAQEIVWTKGISYNLPKVAQFINQAPAPLVIGNRERHHPGNLLALSYLLKPGTRMQFLTPAMTEAEYRLPGNFTYFLYSPVDEFRRSLEKAKNVRTRLLFQDLHLELWIIESVPGHTF
ncbi:MAG: glycosyltransferase family 39 protein [Spirochaetales bacterium]|nr:glycosyltransferase family 39 protein [Spirochaetales bacterium]